jgi:hypothetical protein
MNAHYTILILGLATAAHAAHPIEYVAEHLPEVAMDNRYAVLPVPGTCAAGREYCWGITGGYAQTHSQTLSIDGPMSSVSLNRQAGAWTLTGFVFYDSFTLGSGVEHRPLDVLFTRGVPYQLPADAEFTGMSGQARDLGGGFALGRVAHWPWVHDLTWSAGLLWQSISLSDYRFDYRILAGPDMGSSGTLDYDATYRHFVPFVSLAFPRTGERWALTPHVQLAMPLPKRGVVGHITGAGFDLRGDQDTSGHGAHFGDPSITLGLDLTYRPWNLSFDLGTALSQYLVEPVTHEGVDRNLVLSIRWSP